jgi:hypothetical protein
MLKTQTSATTADAVSNWTGSPAKVVEMRIDADQRNAAQSCPPLRQAISASFTNWTLAGYDDAGALFVQHAANVPPVVIEPSAADNVAQPHLIQPIFAHSPTP